MAVNDKRTDQKWLDQNTYIDSRSKKRTLNKTGRVDLAHDDGFNYVLPTIVVLPTPDNNWTAVVQTTVQTSQGSFTAIGYADRDNCTTILKNQKKDIKDSLPMAEARALNRALDLALNYGRHLAAPEIVAMDEDDAYPEDAEPANGVDHAPSGPLPPASEELIAKLMERQGCDREVIEVNLRKSLKVVQGQDLSALPSQQKLMIHTILSDWVERTNKGAS